MTPVPLSTVRLQLEPGFTLADAAESVPYYASLGVTHLYLSPVLQAAPGSTHGYDVIDHTSVAADIGGDEGLRRLAEVARGAGLGLVVDVVPNHMTTPVPLSLNAPLWSLLREGRESPYASWFDVDWSVHQGRVLLPVLGSDLETAVSGGEITVGVHDGEYVVRYFDHVFPLAPDTVPGGDAGQDASGVGGIDSVGAQQLRNLLARQHYVLGHWRLGGTELNYRRFFDVTSLIGVRVEDPEVFRRTHDLIGSLVADGLVDGLRIDHPDGLADPKGYLDHLRDLTNGAWVVVEKILEGDEELPAAWACAGTTGYDALLRIGGLFLEHAGAAELDAVVAELLGAPQDFESMVTQAKRQVVATVLAAEVNRLMGTLTRALPHVDPAAARPVLEALLVGMDRYRIYIDPDDPQQPTGHQLVQLESALVRGAADSGSWDPAVIEAVIDLAAGQAAGADAAAQRDFVVRFQQTCGPVMAKAIEDTTYYRFVRFVAANEVGGDPGHLGTSPADLHAFFGAMQRDWPTTMTTLTTHDTKRSEDVRARLAVLTHVPRQWREWVVRARELVAERRPVRLDAQTEYLLWQTLVGTWPVSQERLSAYALKAVREAKERTTWVDADADYEAAVTDFVQVLTSDEAVAGHAEEWVTRWAAAERTAVLGQKLVQLTCPGVADVYQGTEVRALTLVDPDNRQVIDVAERADRLRRLDEGAVPCGLDEEKTFVVATALRVRRSHPEAFGSSAGYAPVPIAAGADLGGVTDTEPGAGTDGGAAFAFARLDAQGRPVTVTVVRRDLGRSTDLAAATITVPEGEWVDALSGRPIPAGAQPLTQVIDPQGLPIALLVRT